MAMVGNDGQCLQMADWCVSHKVVRVFDVLVERKQLSLDPRL